MKRRLVFLLLAALAAPGGAAEWNGTATRGAQEWRVRVSGPGMPAPAEITLENRGNTIARGITLTANGRDWSSTDAMLAGVVRPGMSDQEKALALWRFVQDNRYHWYPASGGGEVHDPARFLGVYGYGFCDDSATNLQVLWERAGLRARTWGIEGHVISEVFYSGRWHMLDADTETYYLLPDGKTIAGVEDLQEQPGLARATRHALNPSEDYSRVIEQLYATRENNRQTDPPRSAGHRLAWDLRPGEQVIFRAGNEGRFFDHLERQQPPVFANGHLVTAPAFGARGGLEGLSLKNARLSRAEGQAVIRAADSSKPGALLCPMALPYPVVGASLRARFSGAGPARVRLALSEGEQGQIIWQRESGKAAPEGTLDLSPLLNDGKHPAVYRYWLRFEWEGDAALAGFTLDTVFQHAPRALPQLQPGENRLTYRDAGRKSRRRVQITYRWQPDQFHPARVTRLSPADRSRDVLPDARLSVETDRPLAAVQVHSAAFFLWAADECVPGTVTLDAEGRRVTFRPARPLRPGVRYTAMLGRRPRFAGQQQMWEWALPDSSICWQFTTK